MSNLRLQGNPSGTGTLTIASPNTNSDFTLNLPASGGTFVVDGASQSPTFNAVTATSVATTTLAVAGNNISSVNSLGFRNRIINGDMRIDQRNGGAAVTVNNGFVWSVDRWGGEDGSDGAFTLQQSTTVPSTGGFVNSLQATVTTADTVPAAGQYAVLTQFIEGFNIADFGWGTSSAVPVTISCWVRASVAGTYSCTLYNNGASRINPQPLVINAANTWEYKTITFAGDTSGTWLTNNGRGIVFNIYLLLGTTGAAGWNSGTHFGVTGQANLLATVSNTFNITGVQLEAGSVATPFERRDYGRELELCQRYFVGAYTYNYTCGYDANYAVNRGGLAWSYQMRVTPSIIVASGSMFGHHADTPTAITINRNGVGLEYSGSALRVNVSTNCSVTFTLSAEL